MSDEEKQNPAVEPSVEKGPTPSEKVPTASVEVMDDARTRALTEALQSSFKVVRVIMVILAVVFLGSGITRVESSKKAIHLQFGKYVDTLDPGLVWAWPNPIDKIVEVLVDEPTEITSDVGYRTAEGKEPEASMSFQPTYDGYTLTGDGNVLHIKAKMTFSLDETKGDTIRKYKFGFSDIQSLLTNVLDNAVYHASASRSAIDAYNNKTELGKAIGRRVKETIGKIDSDLQLKIEFLPEVKVPLDVKPVFDAFRTVVEERSKTVGEAEAYAVTTLAKARGQAEVIKGGGQTAANTLLTSVEAEAKAFSVQRSYYEENSLLFEQRLIAETMQRVLTNAVDVFYLSGRTPRIWLNRTPEKRKLKEAGTP
jgi:membrane protease subunit HflK